MAFVRSVLCLFFAAAIGAAQIPIEFAVPSWVTTALFNNHTAADVFGTAHPEIIVMTPTSTIVILDHHDPNQTSLTLTLPSPGRNCVVADLDGDGDRDLAVTCGTSAAPVVSVFIANSGNYARLDYTGGNPQFAIETQDADGDGDLDLLNGASLFLNNGAGVWVPTTLTYAFGGNRESRFGDIDGDGDLDIVGLEVSFGPTFMWQVLRRDPGGIWTPQSPVTMTGARGRLGLADMNGDGRSDVVVYYSRINDVIGFRTYFGTTSGTSTSPVDYEFIGKFVDFVGPPSQDFELGDLDQDGDIDAALTFSSTITGTFNSQAVVMTVLSNQGTGSFTGFPGVGVARLYPSSFKSFTLADDNLDGKLDFFGAWLIPGSSGINIAHAIVPSSTSVSLSSTLPSSVIAWAANAFVEYSFNAQLSDGTPARGHIIEPSLSGTAGPNLALAPRGVIDAFGGGSVYFSTGPTQGTIQVSATTSSGAAYTSPTHYVGPIVTVVSGNSQTLCTNTPSSQPLVVRFESSPGVPLVGVAIQCYGLYLEGVSVSPNMTVTDANGLVSATINPGNESGFVQVVIAILTTSVSIGVSATVNFNVIQAVEFEKVSGDLQTTPALEPFAQPIVVRLRDCNGSPVAGAPFTFFFNAPNGGATLSTPTGTTDALGFAQTFVTAGTTIGTGQIQVTVVGPIPTTFSLSVTPRYVLSGFSGQNQVSIFGQALSMPIVVQLLRFDGQPEAGVPIQFAFLQPTPTLSLLPSTAMTDAQGLAATNVLGDAHEGSFIVVASTSAGSSTNSMGFFRRLRSDPLVTTNHLIYRHEHPFCPLLVAGDLPLPAPGSVTTPFGDIFTSILAPSSSLVVLDGLGLFGPPNGTVATAITGTWQRSFARPIAPLGLTCVLQVYGYDASYPGLDAYFISNAILVTL